MFKELTTDNHELSGKKVLKAKDPDIVMNANKS